MAIETGALVALSDDIAATVERAGPAVVAVEARSRIGSSGFFLRPDLVLTADHGSEAADPACTGDWDEALRQARVPFRDEAYGFIYLGHS